MSRPHPLDRPVVAPAPPPSIHGHLPAKPAAPQRAWRPVAAISALAIGAATIPYIEALLRQDATHRFTGLVGGVDDNNVYLALMRQSREGAWLLTNTFTPEPSRPAVFNAIYALLGRLSGVTGIPLIGVHHIFDAVSAVVFVLLAWKLFAGTFHDRRFRMAGTFLAVFGSGVMGLRALIGPTIGWQMSSPDGWLAEITTFHSIIIYPHFVFSTVLALASLLGFLAGFERQSRRHALLGGLACAALLFSHAFDAAIVLGTLMFFAVAVGLAESLAGFRRLVATGLWFAVPVVPSILATRWMLSREPLWASVVSRLEFTAPTPWELLMGTGITGALALLFLFAGRWSAAGPPSRQLRVLMGRCWLGAVVLMLYLPWIPWQWHLLNGIQIPLSLVALDGLRRHAVFGRSVLRAVTPRWPRAVTPAAGAIALLCVVSSLSGIQLVRGYTADARRASRDFFLTPGDLEAMRWLETSAPRADVVLTAPEIAHFIPRMSGNKAVAGEDLLTWHYTEKANASRRFYSDATDDERRAMLREWGVRYVLHGRAERRLGSWDPATLPELEEIFHSGDTTLWRVRDGL